jgi:probable HAF family extracellular repeat protein
MPNFLPAAALSLLLGATATTLASAIRYDVTDLNAGPGATALAVNASGNVVGYYIPAGSMPGGSHGFLYKNGTFTDIPTFGGLACQATGINDSDVVVGWADYTTAGFTQAFTFINGTMKNRGTLGGSVSYAMGINNANQIVGSSKTAGGLYHAFVFNFNGTDGSTIGAGDDAGKLGGSQSYANAISSGGVGVGQAYVTGDVNYHVTSYYLGPHDLGTLGGDYAVAYGISDAMIVGSSYTAGNALHAFSYDEFGTYTDLGTLPSYNSSSEANGINTKRQIVGHSQAANGARHAFIYQDGAMRDLNAMIAPGSDKVIAEANAINESGQIVGRAYNTASTISYAVLLTPRTIPNPTVVISGKPKIKTTKKKLTVHGSTSGDVTSVTWQINGKAVQTAAGTASWSLNTGKLKAGKNIITATAHGYGGNSAPAQVIIIRR